MGIHVAITHPSPSSSAAAVVAAASAASPSPISLRRSHQFGLSDKHPCSLPIRSSNLSATRSLDIGDHPRREICRTFSAGASGPLGNDDGELERVKRRLLGPTASGAGLPVSLRMLKRKKRREEAPPIIAGDPACTSVRKAFASMVFIIREVQSFALRTLDAVASRDDLHGILARVHADMHASFSWLFERVFSCTPALMLSIMLLLANFTSYSLGHTVAAAVPPELAAPAVVDSAHQFTTTTSPARDSSVKAFLLGKEAAVGESGSGGGDARPIAGGTDDGRPDDSSSLSPSMSSAHHPIRDEEAANLDAVWERLAAEAHRMAVKTDGELLVGADDLAECADHMSTELTYVQAIANDPNNALLLSNFAQFLFLYRGDIDGAEKYFKKAVESSPADAESLGRYAQFLWKARDDVGAAEEMFLEAISADPSNHHHAASYANFLWSTGGEDTCFLL